MDDALNVCSNAVAIKIFADSLDSPDNFQLACQGTPAELIVRERKLKSDTTHVIGLVVWVFFLNHAATKARGSETKVRPECTMRT